MTISLRKVLCMKARENTAYEHLNKHKICFLLLMIEEATKEFFIGDKIQVTLKKCVNSIK